MRPVAAKRKSKSPEPNADDDPNDPDAIADTQRKVSAEKQGPEDEFPGESSDDDCASDFSTDSHTPKKRKTEHTKTKEPPKTGAKTGTKGTTSQKGTNVVKKAARKISATANANYCRLKIRGKDVKGKGRFGKRR